MGARVDRALSPQFFHRSRGASHPSPPASPCLLLPLFPPAARPSPTVGPTGQEYIWVLRPHSGGHRCPRSWGLRRGLRFRLVRGLENFKSSGPAHRVRGQPGPRRCPPESHWAAGVWVVSPEPGKLSLGLRSEPYTECVLVRVCDKRKARAGPLIPNLVPWCVWASASAARRKSPSSPALLGCSPELCLPNFWGVPGRKLEAVQAHRS